MRHRDLRTDKWCLHDAFDVVALTDRQRRLVVLASLFAAGWFLPADFGYAWMKSDSMLFLDALEYAGEAFTDQILASIVLSEAEL